MKFRLERGQSMVEFALSIVILLLLLAGIVDAGRALFTYMAIREGVQEGALYGSVNPSDTNGIEQRVLYTSAMLQSMSSDLDVGVSISGTACTGHAIRVTATYDNFRIATPFLGIFLGGQTFGISAAATDTILTPPCP